MNNQKSLTIENAIECKSAYLDLFSEQEFPVLDMTEIAEIDLSGVQILLGLLKKANQENKILHFTGTVCEKFQAVLSAAGICKEECATGEQLEQALRSLN